MITINQGFCVMYDFLDEYWKKYDRFHKYENSDSFTLVSIISSMEPGRRLNPTPIDPAKYTDWLDILKKNYGDKREFSEKETFDSMIKYLEFYADYFGFNVSGVLEDLKNNICGKYKQMWVEAVKKNLE